MKPRRRAATSYILRSLISLFVWAYYNPDHNFLIFVLRISFSLC